MADHRDGPDHPLREHSGAGTDAARGRARRRSHTWAPLIFLVVTLGGASLTSTVIKLAIARSRPTSEALVDALGYAFPSGHSTAATAGWLAIAVVLAWLSRSITISVILLYAAIVIAVLVGVSRVYLPRSARPHRRPRRAVPSAHSGWP